MAFNYAKRTEHLPLLDQKMLASPRSTRPRRSPQLLPAPGRTGLVACLPPVYAGPGPGGPVISMPGSGSCPGQRPAQPGLLCSESRGRDLVKVHRLGPRPGCAIFSPAAPCPARAGWCSSWPAGK